MVQALASSQEKCWTDCVFIFEYIYLFSHWPTPLTWELVPFALNPVCCLERFARTKNNNNNVHNANNLLCARSLYLYVLGTMALFPLQSSYYSFQHPAVANKLHRPSHMPPLPATTITMTQPTKSSNVKQQQMPFRSSSSVKLVLLAILALLFLNLNASSVILRSTSRFGRHQQQKQKKRPSLREGGPKKTKLAKQQKQQQQQLRSQKQPQRKQESWKVLEQYDEFEEYDSSSNGSVDVGVGEDSIGVDKEAFIEDGVQMQVQVELSVDEDDGDEANDATDGASREEEERRESFYDEKFVHKIRERKESGKKGKIAWLMRYVF